MISAIELNFFSNLTCRIKFALNLYERHVSKRMMVRDKKYPQEGKPYISLFETRNGGLRVGVLKYYPVKKLALSPTW